MSEHAAMTDLRNKVISTGRTNSRSRLIIYAAAAVIGVLALAYFDAGEEPLHPIVHRISLPSHVGDSQ